MVIEKVTTEGIIRSEKKCRKIRAGEVPLLDKLTKVSRCIQVWNLDMRHAKGMDQIQESCAGKEIEQD